MQYRKKRKNNSQKPLTLSDGTEVYEISESFSVNSLIDISFSHRRPVRSRHQKEYERLDNFIVEFGINTSESLLNYIGCTLIAADNYINKNINNSFNNSNCVTQKQMQLIFEQPHITYNKLCRSLALFAHDLSKYNTTSPIDKNDAKNIKLLIFGIKYLNNYLSIISKNNKYKNILLPDYNQYNNVNNKLNNTINKINNTNYITTDTSHTTSSSINDNQWILYAKNKQIKTNGTVDAQFLNIENRISSMENSIGFVSDMKNPYPDTLNAVYLLESRFSYVFHSSWSRIKGFASSMMNDLKNIKYHLDLMQARYKPTEKQTRMEWEKLEDLWIMMNKWDNVVFQLINIVARLKSLQNYHYRTCLFIKRVDKLYKQQSYIYKSLQNDNNILNNCLISMKQNTELLKKNSAYLIQRLNVLDVRLKNT